INFNPPSLPFPSKVPLLDFSARWVGMLKIPKSGHYTFAMMLDDGGRLQIDGKPVIEDWVAHAPARREGQLDLEAGHHDIEVEFFQGGGSSTCKLYWALKDGFADTIVPDDALWHRKKKK